MTITTLTELLLDKKTTVEELTKAIGQQIEEQRKRRRVLSRDKQFSDAWIGVDSDAAQGMKARYIELLIDPNASLQVSDLTNTLGKWENVPPPPHGNPFQIVYRYDKEAFPFLAFIYVSLTGEPDAPQTRIQKIIIRKEERL